MGATRLRGHAVGGLVGLVIGAAVVIVVALPHVRDALLVVAQELVRSTCMDR